MNTARLLLSVKNYFMGCLDRPGLIKLSIDNACSTDMQQHHTNSMMSSPGVRVSPSYREERNRHRWRPTLAATALCRSSNSPCEDGKWLLSFAVDERSKRFATPDLENGHRSDR